MPKFIPLVTNPIEENASYLRVRHEEAKIAKRQRHLDGELFKPMNSTSFHILAQRMTEHFFHNSRKLAIFDDMVLMNKALLVLAPIMQSLPNSMHFDMHQGHVLTWVKVGTNRRTGQKYFFQKVPLATDLDHLHLVENLHLLKVHDERFISVLLDLFRNYYGRRTVTGKLAGTLFDPVMFCRCTEEDSIRVGNVIYRLKKRPFDGCVDLREASGTVLSYSVTKHEGLEQGYLEIRIDQAPVKTFKKRVSRIMASEALPPGFKMLLIERQMNRFIGKARYARSGFEQVVELSRWLRDKITPLKPEVEEAGYFHKIFVNRFMIGLDIKRYPYKRPNFFYDPHHHDILTFIRFFSPFREEI